MCGPEDPLFTSLLSGSGCIIDQLQLEQHSIFTRPPFVARKGPISSKRVSSQDPLLRKFGHFSLNSLNFHPNFSSQAPKFGNFQLTSLQIWKFSAHKPPNLEIFRSQAPLFRGKCPFASPTLWKSGPHTPTWKKVECPPPPPGVLVHKSGLIWPTSQKELQYDFMHGNNQLNWSPYCSYTIVVISIIVHTSPWRRNLDANMSNF